MNALCRKIGIGLILIALMGTGCGDSNEVVVIQLPSNFAAASNLADEVILTVTGPGMEDISQVFPIDPNATEQTLSVIVPVGSDRVFTLIILRDRSFAPFNNLDTNDRLQSALYGQAMSDIISGIVNEVPISLLSLNFTEDPTGDGNPDLVSVELATQVKAPFCGSVDELSNNPLFIIELVDRPPDDFDVFIALDIDQDPSTGGNTTAASISSALDESFIAGAERLLRIAIGSSQDKTQLIDLTDSGAVPLTAGGGELQRTSDANGLVTACFARSAFETLIGTEMGSFNVFVTDSSGSDIAREIENALYDLSFTKDLF